MIDERCGLDLMEGLMLEQVVVKGQGFHGLMEA